MTRYFITGISTGVGKTLAAAIFCEKLQADYWKPVQAGDLNDSDTMKVRRLVRNGRSRFHAEGIRLQHALSPHAAAALEGIEIKLEDFQLPQTDNHLIIEGAGGVLVPLSEELLIIDLIKYSEAEVILVSRHYLGSINHTLLTAEALKNRNIPVAGILFNGAENPASERVIAKMTGLRVLGRIPEAEAVDADFVERCGEMVFV